MAPRNESALLIGQMHHPKGASARPLVMILKQTVRPTSPSLLVIRCNHVNFTRMCHFRESRHPLAVVYSRRRIDPGQNPRFPHADRCLGWLMDVGASRRQLIFRSKDPPLHSEDNNKLEQLKDKVEKEGSKRVAHVSMHAEAWVRDPTPSFFGLHGFRSTEEWSYRSLRESDERVDRDRNTFYRLYLAECFQHRQERDQIPDAEVKRHMFAAIDPKFSLMRPHEQGPICKTPEWRRLDRYLDQGQTFRSMWRYSPGLVMIVGPIMSRDA